MNERRRGIPLSTVELRAQVRLEVEQQGQGLSHFLGNFPNWLRPSSVENSLNYRKILKSFRRLTRGASRFTHGERLPEGEKMEGHSQIWLNQSDLEFIVHVNRAMERQGINPEIVQQMDDFSHEDLDQYDIRQERLADYVLPAYIELREEGYTHHELTA